MTYIGIFVMLVGAVVVFIDPAFDKLWKKDKIEAVESKPDPRIDEILRQLSSLKLDLESKQAVLDINAQKSKDQLEKMAHELEFLQVKVQNQKAPQIKIPDKIAVEIKGPVNVQTVKPLKVLHRQVAKAKPAKATFESVKKQIDVLSK